MFRFIAFLISTCLLVHVFAEPKAESQVLLKYEVFRLPSDAAQALLQPKPGDAELYQSLQRAVQAGTATADKLILMRTLTGQKALAKQAVEFPYLKPVFPDGDFLLKMQELGEVVEITPKASAEQGSIFLEGHVSSTQLSGVASEPRTFVTEQAPISLTGKSGQPSFLGKLQSERATGVGLAFITPIVSAFPPEQKQEVEKENQKTEHFLRAQWEVISLPQATAVQLVSATPDSTEIYGKLQSMISAKTARLETLQLLHTMEGQQCKVEHIDELLYPTSFQPSQTPQSVTITDPVLREQLMKQSDGKNPLPPPNAGSHLTIKAMPTTFTVRNLGDSLELSGSFHNDGSITVTLAAEKVRLLSMLQDQDRDQPCFGLQSLATTVRLQPKLPLLVGTMNRPLKTGAPGTQPEDRVWLAFLTMR